VKNKLSISEKEVYMNLSINSSGKK